MAWTPPVLEDIRIEAGRIDFPVLKGNPEALAVPLPEPEDYPAVKSYTVLRSPGLTRRLEESPDGMLIAAWHRLEMSVFYNAIETAFSYETSCEHRLHPDDPLTAASRFSHTMRFDRPDGAARIRSSLETVCTSETYLLEGQLTAMWQGDVIFETEWKRIVPRRCS